MSRLTDVRDQVEAWIDHQNQYNDIAERDLRRWREVLARGFARTLLGGSTARLGGHEFRIVNLRELNVREFPTVMAVNKRIRCTRRLGVFVGHRFTPAVTSNLRHNLQIVLRPYGIRPVYSDSDMPNGAVFETILERIRAADFSVFDDRETEVRPNVLIELGAAIGMKKPYFYFNYGKKRTVKINNRHEPITTASDLAGTFRTPAIAASSSNSPAASPDSLWTGRWRNRASLLQAFHSVFDRKPRLADHDSPGVLDEPVVTFLGPCHGLRSRIG